MRAIVYMQVDEENNSLLLDKVAELGYVAMHVWTSDTFQIYQVNMDEDHLMLLRLSVPFLRINGFREKDDYL